MGQYIQLIGSIIIGGLLMLSIMNLSSTVSQESFAHTSDNIEQGNFSTLAQIINYDLRNLGKDAPVDQSSIKIMNETSLQFLGDINDDGDWETVTYTLGDMAVATPNPRDRYLYRKVNGYPSSIVGEGIIRFQFKYYNKLGSKTTDPNAVKSIGIKIAAESIRPLIRITKNGGDEQYFKKQFWQTKISPSNLIYPRVEN
jgi:hypothetical protein